ncbi:GTPase ObgE [Spirochaetota bacterium]
MIKFADEILITVSSGNGGNGCVAFRREAHVPLGGPSGGDGGRGGNVVFELRNNLRTLSHLRYGKHYKAQSGQDGMGRGRYGANGSDIVIPLPPGSLIKNAESGEIVKDFADFKEERWIYLKGGNGGWGNIHFKTSTNQAPRTALPGKPGSSVNLKIELQLMADIGFVGFPNAGKSSLLEAFTNARPKIAAYPFTTKIPNLGVLRISDRDLVLADIPGIIEGAHTGSGLGFRFLKHISRTAALAFLIDLSDDNYLSAFDTLLSELEQYSPELAAKPRLIVATKLDLPDTREHLKKLTEAYKNELLLGISVFSREGLPELAKKFLAFVSQSEEANAGNKP